MTVNYDPMDVVQPSRKEPLYRDSLNYGSVHGATPKEFENGALFLQLGLPSTVIRHGAIRKRSSDRRNLKTPTLRLSVERKHFGNEVS